MRYVRNRIGLPPRWWAALALALLTLAPAVVPGPPAAAAPAAPTVKAPQRPTAPAATRADDWTVELSADWGLLWTGDSVQLTAWANQDVASTVYYIYIYDTDTGQKVADCGSGTTCQASVAVSRPGEHRYRAYVAESGATYPPSGAQAQSTEVRVRWDAFLTLDARLEVSDAAPDTGEEVTLTLYGTGTDVGTSPYYLSIFDATDGTAVAVCGAGLSCQAAVARDVAGTRRYVGYLARGVESHPPAEIRQLTSPAEVTWS
ncbi:MAG TPA: hypothetical protein VFY17_06685 [Pilimelia sp.]|nr:hypothetical protein [Pilimelia sp.]